MNIHASEQFATALLLVRAADLLTDNDEKDETLAELVGRALGFGTDGDMTTTAIVEMLRSLRRN